MRLTTCLLALLLTPLAAAQAPAKTVDLGGVKVNRAAGYVEIPGWVSLDRGLIELFACSPKGKRYESALVLDCRPDMFQAGLLFLGLKRGTSGRFAGDEIKTKGSPVQLLVSWNDAKTKQEKRYLAEDLVWNHQTKSSMKRVGWVFVGSRFIKNPRTGREVFMAGATGTLIVTYHDPDAILDTPHGAGSDDTTFYANHLLLPPRGTPITLRIYETGAYKKLPAAAQAMAPTVPSTDKDEGGEPAKQPAPDEEPGK